LTYNPYRINVGSIGLKTNNQKNEYISPAYVVFFCNANLNPEFLYKIFQTDTFNKIINDNTTGSVRQNLKFETLSNIKIPLPSLKEQKKILENYNAKIELAKAKEQEAKKIEESIEEYLFDELGIEKIEQKKEKKGFLEFVEFKDIFEWGIDKILNNQNFISSKYKTTSLLQDETLYINLFRGKSPKYDKLSDKIILNQKCNRWNEIVLEYAKTVKKEWFENINKNFFTQENDILINSTGEGTIGRASNIYKEYTGYLYDSHLLLLRVNKKLLNSEYFVYLFNSSYGQAQVNQIKSAQATKQTELGINNLKKILFPLPPLKTQVKIPKEITKRKEQVKKLKNEAQKNRELAIKEFEREIFYEA
jgi:restriction endonuclease S subunit